jgi:hypothetical protein
MNQEDSIKNINYIVKQMPDSYQKYVWYDVELLNGKKVQARFTKPGFIHLRQWRKHVLRTPEGEILSEKMDWSYYRGNMKTGEIIDL